MNTQRHRIKRVVAIVTQQGPTWALALEEITRVLEEAQNPKPAGGEADGTVPEELYAEALILQEHIKGFLLSASRVDRKIKKLDKEDADKG